MPKRMRKPDTLTTQITMTILLKTTDYTHQWTQRAVFCHIRHLPAPIDTCRAECGRLFAEVDINATRCL